MAMLNNQRVASEQGDMFFFINHHKSSKMRLALASNSYFFVSSLILSTQSWPLSRNHQVLREQQSLPPNIHVLYEYIYIYFNICNYIYFNISIYIYIHILVIKGNTIYHPIKSPIFICPIPSQSHHSPSEKVTCWSHPVRKSLKSRLFFLHIFTQYQS
jgi:hypothetical protein